MAFLFFSAGGGKLLFTGRDTEIFHFPLQRAQVETKGVSRPAPVPVALFQGPEDHFFFEFLCRQGSGPRSREE